MTTTKITTANFPVSGSSGTTRTFSYIPHGLSSAGFVDVMILIWPTTSSRTITSITGTGCTFVQGCATDITLGQNFQLFMGTATTTGARTVTITFSGSITSSATNFGASAVTFQTDNAAPNWQVDEPGWVNDGTSTHALTSASVVVPNGDFMYTFWEATTSIPTASFQPLAWITYVVGDVDLYGDAPSFQNPMPQTGFTQANQQWLMQTMVLKPGPLPAQYVPQVVSGYGSIF